MISFCFAEITNFLHGMKSRYRYGTPTFFQNAKNHWGLCLTQVASSESAVNT